MNIFEKFDDYLKLEKKFKSVHEFLVRYDAGIIEIKGDRVEEMREKEKAERKLLYETEVSILKNEGLLIDNVLSILTEYECTDGANECPVCHVKPTMLLWTEQDLLDQRVFMRRLRCPKCRYTVSEIDGTEKNLIKNWNRYQQLRDEVMKSHEKNEGEK